MLEKQIEDKVCRYARDRGVLAYKFNSAGRAAVPDRMFVAPTGTIIFVEFKRTGQKPTPAQVRELTRLKEKKVAVFVCDNVERGKMIIDTLTVDWADIKRLSESLWEC